jgi:hypothetical protein
MNFKTLYNSYHRSPLPSSCTLHSDRSGIHLFSINRPDDFPDYLCKDGKFKLLRKISKEESGSVDPTNTKKRTKEEKKLAKKIKKEKEKSGKEKAVQGVATNFISRPIYVFQKQATESDAEAS